MVDNLLTEACEQEISKILTAELHKRESTWALKYLNLENEYNRLKEQNTTLITMNNGLRRKLNWKANYGIEDSIKGAVIETRSELDCILQHVPDRGWHCSDSRSYRSDEYEKYTIAEDPRILASYIRRFLNKFERYEREMVAYDQNLHKWVKQLMSEQIGINRNMYVQDLYDCPRGGQCTLPFITKMLSSRNDINMKKRNVVEVYPKVKVLKSE